MSWALRMAIAHRELEREAIQWQYRANNCYFLARLMAFDEDNTPVLLQRNAARCSLRARQLMGIEE